MDDKNFEKLDSKRDVVFVVVEEPTLHCNYKKRTAPCIFMYGFIIFFSCYFAAMVYLVVYYELKKG